MSRKKFIMAAMVVSIVFASDGALNSVETQQYLINFAYQPIPTGAVFNPFAHNKFQELQTRSMWVFAGNDTTICNTGNWISVNGSAGNYWYAAWSTAGDGFFDDANALSANYFPGLNDKTNGDVYLYLTVYSYPYPITSLTDSINITIVPAPMVNAGPSVYTCESEYFEVIGQASNYSSISWTTTGDGSFDDPSALETFYHPGINDIEEGETALCLLAAPDLPCQITAFDCMAVFIQKLPVVNLPADTTVCKNSRLRVQCEAKYYDSVLWTTSGDGSFCDPSLVSPDYFPGSLDVSNGHVELQITASSFATCNAYVSKTLDLNIQPHPSIHQQPYQEVCINDTIRLQATGSNYANFYWLSYGDGDFINPHTLHPRYMTGDLDKQRGFVYLEVIANAMEPCNFYIGSFVEVTIHKNVVLNAGNDTIVCEQVQLNASCEHYETIMWTTDGDGYFSDEHILNPMYFPGPNDLINKEVQLSAAALPFFPCEIVASDQLLVIFDVPDVLLESVDDHTMNVGDTLEMSFYIESFSQGNYTWYHNNALLPNSDSPVFNITGASVQSSGKYYCEFENQCGVITSPTAMITILETVTQELLLAKGWSGISSFLIPDTLSITALFEPVIDNVVILMNDDGVFWPDANLNTIVDWNYESGYVIKLDQQKLFSIDGFIKHPADPVSIPPGWSLMPVRNSCSVHVASIFGDVDEIMVIKEITGTKFYWPVMQINTLEYLVPGEAYQILNSGNQTIFLEMPACDN